MSRGAPRSAAHCRQAGHVERRLGTAHSAAKHPRPSTRVFSEAVTRLQLRVLVRCGVARRERAHASRARQRPRHKVCQTPAVLQPAAGQRPTHSARTARTSGISSRRHNRSHGAQAVQTALHHTAELEPAFGWAHGVHHFLHAKGAALLQCLNSPVTVHPSRWGHTGSCKGGTGSAR